MLRTAAKAFVFFAAFVRAAALNDWQRCLQSTHCRLAYQQHTDAGDEKTFNALYSMGASPDVSDSRTSALLAHVAHLGSICRRNEMFVEGRCVCPDPDQECGEVTPFFNGVIYGACIFSSLAIVAHVVHDVWLQQPPVADAVAGTVSGGKLSYQRLLSTTAQRRG